MTYIARVVPIVPSANYHQDTQEATSPITILGEPIIPNGLALCKLHHAAFDRNLLGVRPDLVVEVRTDILREVDGPMLKYGLQDMQGQRISVPHADRLRPRREFLEERFAAFERAA